MLVLGAMATADLFVLAVCGLFAVRGAFKGFAWQAVRTIGLVAALWIAGFFNGAFGGWLDENVGFLPSDWTEVAAWLLIVLGIWLLVAFLARIARGVVRTANLSATDRVLGLALGAVMGVAICTVAFVVYGRIVGDDDLEESLRDSVSIRFVAKFVHAARPLIPAEICDRFKDTLDTIENASDAPTPDS